MRRFAVFAVAAVVVVAVVGSSSAGAEDQPLPQAVTHVHWNGVDPALSAGQGTLGESAYKNPSNPICSTSGPNTDCEGVAPHNETSIATNPTNPQNMIAGANDYQLRTSRGGTINESVFSRAHVTFDGGATWTTVGIRYKGYYSTGDPGLAFDADGNAYYSTLGFVWSQGGPTGTNADILVASSSDGGSSWSTPVRVASGTGSWGSPGIFNDKEMITAWGHGNAIVTWTVFNQGIGGSYINSPIYASVTHDAGRTWSAPQQISGSASFCVGIAAPDACDQDQGSTPVVAADGSIYVSFLSTRETTHYSDQYLVVRVDPTTGALAGGPWKVADIVDGTNDYPVSIDGRQTYQDSQFRSWSLGNIAADPTNASHLAVVWSDMRNTLHPVNPDPYQAVTNSDVVVSQSFDGGNSWSPATAITVPNDQFMPWAGYGQDGKLRIGYFDRSYDPANHAYGYTLATETAPGSLTFAYADLTAGTYSDPTHGDRWFSGRTPNPDFPNPTTFLGDYSGIDASQGFTAALWTDLRNPVTFGTRTGTGQDAWFGSAP
jgi:hypothetical protein